VPAALWDQLPVHGGAAQYARHRAAASRCNARRNRNTASHCRSSRRRTRSSEPSSSRRIAATGPSYVKFGAVDLPRRRGTAATPSPLVAAMVSVDVDAIEPMEPMQSQATDTDPLPRRYRTWLALTGLTDHQFRSVQDRPPDPTGCWAPLGAAAARPAATGTDPLAHQPDHPGTGRLVRHQPIHPGPDHRPPGAGAGQRTTTRRQRRRSAVDHRRHPDPGARPVDHRDHQQLPAQRQHPNRQRRAAPHPDHSRPLLARQPQRRHRGPPHRRPSARRHPANPGRRPIPRHRHDHQSTPSNRQPGSSTTTTTANTGVSAPASNTSPPGSKTGKSCGNADDAAKPSTTASTPSPDSGTSRPVDNYGSTARRRLRADRLPPKHGPAGVYSAYRLSATDASAV
jgi:hypothetical protein